MSVRIMTLVWATDLPAREKLVLLALADCANDDGRCWPGRSALLAKTGHCMRTLQEALRSLDSEGHISRHENPGKGVIYTVHPVANSAPVANPAPVAGIAAGDGKICHGGVAKSAPKPSKNHKEPSPKKRAIPENWIPADFPAGSESRKVVDSWPPGELEAQVEQFRAHHGSKNNTFSDLQKAWSTWVLNTRKWGIGKRHERADPNPTGTALSRVHAALRSGGAFN